MNFSIKSIQHQALIQECFLHDINDTLVKNKFFNHRKLKYKWLEHLGVFGVIVAVAVCHLGLGFFLYGLMKPVYL